MDDETNGKIDAGSRIGKDGRWGGLSARAETVDYESPLVGE